MRATVIAAWHKEGEAAVADVIENLELQGSRPEALHEARDAGATQLDLHLVGGSDNLTSGAPSTSSRCQMCGWHILFFVRQKVLGRIFGSSEAGSKGHPYGLVLCSHHANLVFAKAGCRSPWRWQRSRSYPLRAEPSCIWTSQDDRNDSSSCGRRCCQFRA